MKNAHAHDVAINRPAGRGGPGRHPLRHAAPGALRRDLDLPSSFGLYNTMQEVDKLADALKAEALFAWDFDL